MSSGYVRSSDCFVGDYNIGCGYDPPSSAYSTYGDSFNGVGGGVYAMLWDREYIKVWHFSRDLIPADIEDKEPKPDGWGMPLAVFGGSSCDVDEYFNSMRLVLNIVSLQLLLCIVIIVVHFNPLAPPFFFFPLRAFS
jgi:hypothetical protein